MFVEVHIMPAHFVLLHCYRISLCMSKQQTTLELVGFLRTTLYWSLEELFANVIGGKENEFISQHCDLCVIIHFSDSSNIFISFIFGTEIQTCTST